MSSSETTAVKVPTIDEVRAAIKSAWKWNAPPPPDRITATYDDEGVAAYFGGRTWKDHDVQTLRYHSVGLSFFTTEAFCYYLPAYMLAVLQDLTAADVIYDGIFFHLSPTQLGAQWADSYLARVAGFSVEQKNSIIAYLTWCADRYEDGSAVQKEIIETIEYLRSGQVRAVSSTAERLLELSGLRNRAPHEITWLRLAHTKVVDEDLAGLSAFSSLHQLDLGGSKLSDAGLSQLSRPEVVAALSNLEGLDLSGGRQFTVEGLRHVAKLSRLAELKLSNAELSDEALAALAPLALQRINLVHSRKLTEVGFAALDVSRLEELAMFGVSAPDSLLERLGNAGKLRTLDCRSVHESGLIALCRDHALAHLELGEAAAIREPGLRALAALPALQKLQLGGLICSSWPSGFPALTELSLLSGELAAEGAAGLAELPRLSDLRLFGERVATGALGQLAKLAALRDLTLWCEDLSDEKLLELGGSALQQLSVHKSKAGNAAVEVVTRLPELRELELDGMSIDDQAMTSLSRAAKLETLRLQAVPITDSGLQSLAYSSSLRFLRLSGTKVTKEGIVALRDAAPALEVVET